MNKAFTPISLGVGFAAGQVGKKIFQFIWARFDEQEPPLAKHREVDRRKLLIALLVQGAIFSLVKGLVDHGLRHAWAGRAGEWPGEERPDSE